MIKHVWGPLDVIDVLRESGIDGSVDETAVICLGEECEVKVVVAIEGDREDGWIDGLETVLLGSLPGMASAVVFASCRADGCDEASGPFTHPPYLNKQIIL